MPVFYKISLFNASPLFAEWTATGLGPVFDVVELLEHGQQHAGLEGAVLSRIEDLPPRMRHAGSLE